MNLKAVKGLSALLIAVGLDLAKLRADSTPVLLDWPALTIAFEPGLEQGWPDSANAPIVVGKIAGADSQLAREYVVVIARMDHTGLRSTRADSVANEINDNASGVAGLIALANAFCQLGVQPRRPILFAAVSGGAKDFWGSRHLLTLIQPGFLRRKHPAAVAVLNLDIQARPTGDTLTVAGLQEVGWPTPPAWLAAAHPELGLTLAGETLFRPTSDHFPFVQAWIPSLSFQTGRGKTKGVRRSEEPNVVDAEWAARVARLAFHVGLSLTTTDARPQWTAEGRRAAAGGQP